MNFFRSEIYCPCRSEPQQIELIKSNSQKSPLLVRVIVVTVVTVVTVLDLVVTVVISDQTGRAKPTAIVLPRTSSNAEGPTLAS